VRIILDVILDKGVSEKVPLKNVSQIAESDNRKLNRRLIAPGYLRFFFHAIYSACAYWIIVFNLHEFAYSNKPGILKLLKMLGQQTICP